MNAGVIDSSVWIEILGKGKKSRSCEDLINKLTRVVVPTTVLFEVYKKINLTLGESEALLGVSSLQQYQVVDLTSEVALTAADLAIKYELAMADSIVLAHANALNATLYTLDNDFRKIPFSEVL